MQNERCSSAPTRRASRVKPEPQGAAPSPKRVPKNHLDLVLTGKQILRRSDRANSLPGSSRRRLSLESVKKPTREDSQSSKSRETSLEDDMSLDLSQVSDFEDMNSKYGVKQTFRGLATSTPKVKPKPRSCSLQHQVLKRDSKAQILKLERPESKRQDCRSRDTTFSSSFKTSTTASAYRHGVSTDLDYSSVSPEYSGQSSTELSPRVDRTGVSQDMSSCCVSNWLECSDSETKVEETRTEAGEWNSFWVNYNNSIAKVPVKSYYDQCPTPYRTENIDLADLDFSAEGSRKRSPEDIKNLNSIIRNEGLHLTPRETQNIIKCAHILGNVLTKAIERRSKEKDEDKIQEINLEKDDPEIEKKKKTMTLELKETHIPLKVQEEKRSETVTTQTDISLPNTKSAPKIFENILRQLSRSSIDEGLIKKAQQSIDLENNEKIEKVEVEKKA